jgi:asparagine N-glycosylation enzyme membrane subunit Stt3
MTNVQSARPNIWITALTAGVIAAIVNVIVYFIAGAANVPLQIAAPGSSQLERLQLVPVILASLIPAFVAAGLLLILRRFAPRADTVFQVIALVFTLVSFGGPLGQPTDGASKFVLNLMHVVAGAIITIGLTRPSRA